ncbi:hypothetical protein BASA81_007083 [Batrachochytrium salamandrivorans]|nr:hypothetical protein BASA81_007083 [Batrachochytrium salamandrivorans]
MRLDTGKLKLALSQGQDKVSVCSYIHSHSDDGGGETSEDEIVSMLQLLAISHTKELVWEFGLEYQFMIPLTTALQNKTTQLRVLDVSENLLGCDSALLLADMLCTNTSLEELDLSGNEIEDDGAVALANALRVNPWLKLLDLSDNEIGDFGAEAMVLALEGNYGLKRINLFRNRVSDLQLLQQLRHVLDTNEQFRLLVAIRSAQLVPRLGKDSFAKALPGDLCRILKAMLM